MAIIREQIKTTMCIRMAIILISQKRLSYQYEVNIPFVSD